MNDILNDVQDLKIKILNSDEYKNFKKYEQVLDNNKEINEIISEIKKVQQTIIKKEDINENVEKDQIELNTLYKKLDTYSDYKNYIESSKKLNEMITYIQKEFENYFNKFII